MQSFENEFEEFCKSPSVNSGKARSYTKAIRYLCDYMGINEMNEETVGKIRMVENGIKDKDSAFYRGLLEFLDGQKRRSYLENGFISAALKYLFAYYK